MNATERAIRKRIRRRSDAALTRVFAKRAINQALDRLPREAAVEVLCMLLVERAPELFEEDVPEEPTIPVIADPAVPGETVGDEP